MREILFRGKKVKPSVFDETDWVYGSLIDSGNHEQVAIYPWYDGASTMSVRQLVYARMEGVKPETVGQFTGLTDKNGKKIFEGDIVKMSFEGTSRGYEDEFFGTFYDEEFYGHKIGVVTFGGHGTFLKASHGELWINEEKAEDWKPARRSRLAAYRSEVIGNIHDNPELLEEVEK